VTKRKPKKPTKPPKKRASFLDRIIKKAVTPTEERKDAAVALEAPGSARRIADEVERTGVWFPRGF
jgi:hypothetical protein